MVRAAGARTHSAFLYHKPRGLMTTHSDPEGRDTIFRALPKGLPQLIQRWQARHQYRRTAAAHQ
jgi:16S rRNA U516 pseudouridylate synthase RsuA-like enzyme